MASIFRVRQVQFLARSALCQQNGEHDCLESLIRRTLGQWIWSTFVFPERTREIENSPLINDEAWGNFTDEIGVDG